ncbi:hypothetical protein B0T25DRAFT_529393, partial [Lasiosphaeria hispida]
MHWAETTTRQFGSLMFCFVFPSFYQAADMDLWAQGFTWEIPCMVSMGCIRICFRVPSTGPAAKGRGPSNILSFCGSAVFISTKTVFASEYEYYSKESQL